MCREIMCSRIILIAKKIWLIGKDSDAGRDWGQEEKGTRSEEHTSELQSRTQISYAVFCL